MPPDSVEGVISGDSPRGSVAPRQEAFEHLVGAATAQTDAELEAVVETVGLQVGRHDERAVRVGPDRLGVQPAEPEHLGPGFGEGDERGHRRWPNTGEHGHIDALARSCAEAPHDLMIGVPDLEAGRIRRR